MAPTQKNFILVIGLLLIISLAFFFKDIFYFTPDDWQQSVAEVGSSSSPRAVDLNSDGVLDIVVGAGGKEFFATQYGVLVFDGKDGSLLWSRPARNQVTGSAVFLDINKDKTPDVIIGGRSAVLYALDGRDGSILWEHLPDYEGMDALNDTTILNFFNPQFIPDVDDDGFEDLLISYGGFVKALPYETDRPLSYLMVFSSKTGSVLAKVPTPDGLETYMSPLVHDINGDGRLEIIFGTGGETIEGYLYRADLKNLLEGSWESIATIAEGGQKGFIAPPILIDVNQDDIKDIVVNAVNGRILCIDGKTNETIWDTSVGSGYEGYAMPAPGYFVGEDSIPDFFGCFGYGAWPNSEFALDVLIDGLDGHIVSRDTLGTFQYASPLVFDFTADGHDDVLVTANLSLQGTSLGTKRKYGYQMRVFDVKYDEIYSYQDVAYGTNLGSTPLLTDLDDDGRLDIISCYMSDPDHFYSFKELIVERKEVDLSVQKKIRWGAYMGSDYTGVLE